MGTPKSRPDQWSAPAPWEPKTRRSPAYRGRWGSRSRWVREWQARCGPVEVRRVGE